MFLKLIKLSLELDESNFPLNVTLTMTRAGKEKLVLKHEKLNLLFYRQS